MTKTKAQKPTGWFREDSLAPGLAITVAAFVVAAFETGGAEHDDQITRCPSPAADQREVWHVDVIQRMERVGGVVAQEDALLPATVESAALMEVR